MKQSKGSMIKTFIVGIRADKSGAYDALLNEEDKQVIHSKILDSIWYPYGTYKRSFNTVTKVFAKGNMEIVRRWGRDRGKEITNRLYRGAQIKRDLRTAVALYNRFFKLWFNFGKQTAEIISENEVNLSYEDFDMDFEAFYYTAIGWIESAFSILTGKKIIAKFLSKS
ncbi:MAG: hypothetical protein JW891_07595 [Candidatus Lokiarchaeota archaeon]|nr:hypothetical protein [Candidatus Lokiarchaeota archaeon]